MTQRTVERNNVTVHGSGPKTIVFAHGFGCDQLVWHKMLPEFETDYRIVLFDYVGAGESDKAAYSIERYSSLHGYKDDLIEVCDALNLKGAILVAHSVSSMVGLLASIERPELFEKIVMIGPSPCYLNEPNYNGGFEKEDIIELLNMMEMNYKEWAKYLAPVIMQNAERPELAVDFEKVLCENDPVISRRFAEVTFLSDTRDELSRGPVPTLILQMKNDAIAPAEVGRYVHEHIPGSEFVLMEATGHNPHISHAKETAEQIRAYLEK